MNLIQSNIKTMTTLEVAELVESRHDSVVRSAKRLADRMSWALPPMVVETSGRNTTAYSLDKNQSLTLVAQLMPEFLARVVDRWQELEEKAAKPMSQLAVLAGMANSMLEQERKQLEQAEALASVETKLVAVEKQLDAQVWDECPVNALSISAIRQRINDKYSIPAWAVDEIVRGGYGPRPAGQVRNTHENAAGRTYTAYWLSDITKLFDRIEKESERLTPTLVSHKYVSKRFKLVK